MEYIGISYPGILANPLVWWIWRKLFCHLGWHLWDEVSSVESHYMYCDACEKSVRLGEEMDD